MHSTDTSLVYRFWTFGMSSGRLEKTTRSSPHLVAQHRPGSSRFGSEPPFVEDDADVWRYAILEFHARNDDDDEFSRITALADCIAHL